MENSLLLPPHFERMIQCSVYYFSFLIVFVFNRHSMTKQLCMITLDWRLYPNKIVGAHDQPNKVLKLNFSEFYRATFISTVFRNNGSFI